MMSTADRNALIEHIADVQSHGAPVTLVIGKDSVLIRRASHMLVEAVMLWVRNRKVPEGSALIFASVTPKGLLIS